MAGFYTAPRPLVERAHDPATRALPPARGHSCPQQAPQGNGLRPVPKPLCPSNAAADKNVRAPTRWQCLDPPPLRQIRLEIPRQARIVEAVGQNQ
jgi:hypothetical protein